MFFKVILKLGISQRAVKCVLQNDETNKMEEKRRSCMTKEIKIKTVGNISRRWTVSESHVLEKEGKIQ